jgi:hypothetical protein
LPSTTLSFNLRTGASLSQTVDGIDKALLDLRRP